MHPKIKRRHRYIAAFEAAAPAAKEAVLAMHHPDVGADTDSTRNAQMVAAQLVAVPRAAGPLPFPLVHRLILIHTCNAHESHPASARPGRARRRRPPRNRYEDARGRPCAALFAVASKASHDCSPNGVFSIRGGLLRYHAIRAIEAGQQVTFSYLVPESFFSSPSLRSTLFGLIL